MTAADVKLTIQFIDPELDLEEREEQAQMLMAELRESEAVETVDRVPDPNPPVGSKSIGSFLVGILTAEVNAANLGKVFGFLGGFLERKPIELSVEVKKLGKTKTLTLKAYGQKDLEAALKAAREFVES
ncbi:MAG: hypothetical protein AAGG51_21905 [Cyanobacteria bacterium P01_G01_bin.54]